MLTLFLNSFSKHYSQHMRGLIFHPFSAAQQLCVWVVTFGRGAERSSTCSRRKDTLKFASACGVSTGCVWKQCWAVLPSWILAVPRDPYRGLSLKLRWSVRYGGKSQPDRQACAVRLSSAPTLAAISGSLLIPRFEMAVPAVCTAELWLEIICPED